MSLFEKHYSIVLDQEVAKILLFRQPSTTAADRNEIYSAYQDGSRYANNEFFSSTTNGQDSPRANKIKL